jgi:O-antigen/teichoic acid export membrane protein
VFLLKALSGSDQLGYYSIASQIVDVIGILPQSIALVLFPTLIAAGANQFRTTLRNLTTVAVLLIVGCAGIGLVAPPFIQFVFGPSFLPAVSVLRWMLPSAFFLGLTSIASQYLAAAGFPISLVAIWIVGAAAAASLGALLIPASGGVGAAIALSITHVSIFSAIAVACVLHARRKARLAAASASTVGELS